MPVIASITRARRGQPRTLGQSLVEFAIILPVFLLFFGAVLDLGRIAAARVTVSNAAREGAFQAATTPTDFDSTKPCPADGSSNLVVCRTLLEAKGSVVSIAPSDISVSCNPSSCAAGLGNTVTVGVVGQFQLVTPILAAFFGGSQNVTFSASSTHQIETLPAASGAGAVATPTPTPSATATPTPTPTSGACELPSAGFTHTTSPKSGQAPVTLTVTDTSTSTSCGITSWFWDFDDGAVSSAQNPSPHTYYAKGKYYVTLKVENAAGDDTTGKVEIWVK